MTDGPSNPVPTHVQAWAVALSTPLISAALVAIPIGLLCSLLATVGLSLTQLVGIGLPGASAVIDGAAGWVAGTLVIYLELTKPY
jgi:hypothetical protein